MNNDIGFGYISDDEPLPPKFEIQDHIKVKDCRDLPGMASSIAVMSMTEDYNKRNLKGSEYITMPRILISGIKSILENNIGNHLNECQCKLCKYYHLLTAFGIFAEDYEPPVLER